MENELQAACDKEVEESRELLKRDLGIRGGGFIPQRRTEGALRKVEKKAKKRRKKQNKAKRKEAKAKKKKDKAKKKKDKAKTQKKKEKKRKHKSQRKHREKRKLEEENLANANEAPPAKRTKLLRVYPGPKPTPEVEAFLDLI